MMRLKATSLLVWLPAGVLSGELKLSEEPPLGDWSILVKTPSGSESEHSFNIDKYGTGSCYGHHLAN